MSEDNKLLNIFSTPEDIDKHIRKGLANQNAKGGSKVCWTKDEIEIMDFVIMEYLTVNMLSPVRTAYQLVDRWGMCYGVARKHVADAQKRWMKKHIPETEELMKTKFTEQLNTILQEAQEAGDRQSAIKALDMLAKTAGFYNDKKDLKVSMEGPIRFDFGQE